MQYLEAIVNVIIYRKMIMYIQMTSLNGVAQNYLANHFLPNKYENMYIYESVHT